MTHALSLRQKFNLIFIALSMTILGALVVMEIHSARTAVREEIEASHRIANQLLERITRLYALGGLGHLADFLEQTGRIRANEVVLTDDFGRVLYASPDSMYKTGRSAPHWYTAIVAPDLPPKVLSLRGGTMTITPNATRAVLDAWDELKTVVLTELLVLIAANVLLLWTIGRWVAPLERVSQGLRDIERGQHQVRLPPLPGREAGEMGRSFNRMAQAVEDNIAARKASAEAEARLAAQREFTQMLHQRIEEERATLARELHDELGQSLTAIRTIAKSLLQMPAIQQSASERYVRMLFDTAGATSDALQRMIPRLRPLQLEGMGLGDAVRDMVSELQLQHGEIKFYMQIDPQIPAMPDAHEISAYRIAQEALTNVVRHAQASEVSVVLERLQDSLLITIADNGKGAPDGLVRAGHYGVRGMQERAAVLGGTVEFEAGSAGGLTVIARLPIVEAAKEATGVQA